MEQVTEQYWGESEVEAIYEELTRRDNVAGDIAALTFRANINYQETGRTGSAAWIREC